MRLWRSWTCPTTRYPLDHLSHIPDARRRWFRKPFTIIHAKNLHVLMISQERQQLGRNQEVLPALGVASDLDELIMDGTFVSLIHALIILPSQQLDQLFGETFVYDTWLISSTSEKGALACSVKLMRYMIVVSDRSYWKLFKTTRTTSAHK